MATKEERFAARLERANRIKQALEHRALGLGFAEIGEAMGCSTTAAYNMVDTGLKAIPQEAAEELRKLELARLDKMLQGIATKANAGDLHSIDRAIRIQERRAALMGIDAEKSVRVLVEKEQNRLADKLEAELPPDVFKRVLEVLFGATSPGEVSTPEGERGDASHPGADSDD